MYSFLNSPLPVPYDSAVQALAFTLSRSSPSYTGELPPDEYRRIFAQASGRYGSTHDYAHDTLHGLRQVGIHDQALARLLQFSGPPPRLGGPGTMTP